MHPMFAELFMTPEEPDADERRRARRVRRTRQVRTLTVVRGRPGNSRTAPSGPRAP